MTKPNQFFSSFHLNKEAAADKPTCKLKFGLLSHVSMVAGRMCRVVEQAFVTSLFVCGCSRPTVPAHILD